MDQSPGQNQPQAGDRWKRAKFILFVVLLAIFVVWFVVETFFPPPFRKMAF